MASGVCAQFCQNWCGDITIFRFFNRDAVGNVAIILCAFMNHPQWVFGGLHRCTKFVWNWCSGFVWKFSYFM